MINDRFNNNSKFDLKSKFRDKKFVSTVGIGIFVLILIIVLIASCNKKKGPNKQTAQQQTVQQQTAQQQTAPQQAATVDYTNAQQNATQQTAAPQNTTTDYTDAGDDAQSLMLEGKHYYNGDGGKRRDYRKAREYFVRAKKLGAKNADYWIKKCNQKLPGSKTKKRR